MLGFALAPGLKQSLSSIGGFALNTSGRSKSALRSRRRGVAVFLARASAAPPPTYPVTTSTSRGVSFAVAAGYVVTCEHTVRSGADVAVAGSPGKVVATCAADVALISVPGLSAVKLPPLVHQESLHLAEMSGAYVCDASGNIVHADVVDMPGIMYGSSGAVLPALRLRIHDRDFISEGAPSSRTRLARGWSGSPVLDLVTNTVLGMVVHGGIETDCDGAEREIVFAAPVGVLQSFVRDSLSAISRAPGYARLQHRAWRHEIPAIAPLTIQPLDSPRSLDATLLSSTRAGWNSCCGLLNGGARVVSAPEASRLNPGDVIVKVGEHDVGWDGCISMSGLRATLQAAFIGSQPRSTAQLRVLGASGDGPAELQVIHVRLGRGEEVILDIPSQCTRRVLLAGGGTAESMRLAELSVEWLQRRYGEEWASVCDHDLYTTAFKTLSYSAAAARNSHIVIEADKSSPDLIGSRVVAAAGKPVEHLNDIMDIVAENKLSAVVLELADGWITSLPFPLRIEQDG
jgi:hypothetical protein